MNEPGKLHPVYLFFALLQTIKGLLPIFIITLLRGVNWSDLHWYWYAGVSTGIVLLLIYGYFDWSKFTYQVEEDRIVIRKGVLFRDEKTIFFRRIHSVNIAQPFVQRLLGVVQVNIETPGGNKKADGILAALSAKDAEQLRTLLLKRRESSELQAETTSESPQEILAAVPKASKESTDGNNDSNEGAFFQMDTGKLFMAAATSMNFGLVAAFIAGLVSFADDVIKLFAPEHFLEEVYRQSTSAMPIYLLVVVIAISGIVMAWLLSILLYILKYSGFTVRKDGKQISVSYGMLDRKTHLFDPKKVQAVIVQEGIVRQMLGYAQIQLQVISSDKKERMILHPFLPVSELQNVIEIFVPQIKMTEVKTLAPARALIYYLRIELLLTLIASAVLIGFFKYDGLWSLLLIPIVALWRWSCYRAAGMSLDNGQLTLRGRNLARVTYMIRRPQIVVMKVKQTRGQQRKELLSLSVHAMGSVLDYSVTCLDQAEVKRVWKWYSREK